MQNKTGEFHLRLVQSVLSRTDWLSSVAEREPLTRAAIKGLNFANQLFREKTVPKSNVQFHQHFMSAFVTIFLRPKKFKFKMLAQKKH
jgi:hypothetical protein